MNPENPDSAYFAVRPEFQRLALLVGEASMAAMEQKQVIVIGLGGVGSWAAEALVRSGIGRITIVDNDVISPSNINRQIEALPATVGLPKATALARRLHEINPRCKVSAFNQIFSGETASLLGIDKADYVIDAIDSMPHKLDLIEIVIEKTTLFSSMGMAQKLDPTRIKTADIWSTRNCPIARLVRQGLRKRGFTGNFTVVYSDEQHKRQKEIQYESGGPTTPEWSDGKKIINGSLVTVTATAGMILASLVIRDIMNKANNSIAGAGFISRG